MIVIDLPIRWSHPLNQRLGASAHLLSDQPGPRGSEELARFARRIGLQASWLQHAATYREHYDVFENRRARAIAAGAKQITRKEFVAILRAKRVYERENRCTE